MTNIIIGGRTYNDVLTLKVPSATQGKYALFGFMREIDGDEGSVTFIDYVDSNKSAYVFLPVKFSYPTNDYGYRLYIKFRINITGSTQMIMSSRFVSSKEDQLVLSGSNLVPQRGSGNIAVSTNDVIEYIEINGNITINNLTTGETYTTTAGETVMNIESPNDMCLFGQPDNGTARSLSNIRFFELSYSENGIELTDLVPAVDLQNHLCLYDKVADEIVYASGGTFVVGS